MTDVTTTMTPVLQAKGLTKRYGRVVAIDGSDLELYPGEILAVIGDNGAGKSSLIKALSGMSAPESALIRLDLPAPLSPITARISPGYSSRSLPSMATTRPYRLVMPFACNTGVMVVVTS